jgi:replicative DNA helicase
VPQRVFAQPPAGIARFLRHLWATDGCIHLSEGKISSIKVYYATSSAQLAADIRSLLLRLSINATVLCYPQLGKGRDQYHVTVSGKPDIERFFACIGTLGQSKTLNAAAIAQTLAKRTANTNRDVLPHELWRLIAVPAMQMAGLTTRQMQAGLGNTYCGTGLYKQNLGRERAARLAQVIRSEELAKLASSDVYWDRIVAIEPDGEAEVYDLTVDSLHNLVVNDTIVHNSIEQDADVVMFIYRDELYDPNSSRRGIADIIIAKHRNGPVDQVPLRFYANLNVFDDQPLTRRHE